MNFPLARDQQGNPFTLPSDAAYWRVRRHTGGRPSTVLGPDGEPLFVAITSDRGELQAYGCNGSIRLEAVDGDYRSVRAPVGYVEFAPNGAGDSLRKTETQSDSPELVRASLESLTRTMEAMQRSQVERERAIGHREKAVTDAQIEMQRSHTQLIVALLDKATGGQPQDPLTLIQNQEKINKALEASAAKFRNGAVEVQAAPELPAAVPETGTQIVAKWMGMIAPYVPQLVEPVASTIGDLAKAQGLRRNAAIVGNVMSGLAGMAGYGSVPAPMHVPQAPAPTVVLDDDDEEEDEDDDDEIVVRTPSKGVRQMLAMLEDDEATGLVQYMGRLDNDEFDEFERAAATIENPEERLAWARGLTFAAAMDADAESTEEESEDEDSADEEAAANGSAAPQAAASSAPAAAQSVATAPTALDIPPALFPVLAQLSQDEQIVGIQILQALDSATVEKLKADLIALPTDQALAMVRRMVAHAQQRSASVAHRAVMAAMAEQPKSTTKGQS